MTSIRVSDETLFRLDEAKPKIAVALNIILKSNDDAINALLDYFEAFKKERT
jgi:hypothetical protein